MNFPAFRRPLPVVLRVLLSLGFLAAAVGKFIPKSGWEARFVVWGYPTWFAPIVGAIEVLGVIGLWIPRTSQPSMLLLAGVMLEASYASLSHPPIVQAIRPAAFMVLLLGLSITQRRPLRSIAAPSAAA